MFAPLFAFGLFLVLLNFKKENRMNILITMGEFFSFAQLDKNALGKEGYIG